MIDASLPGPVKIRGMREEDLDFADALREEVGWNQTRDDWRRFRAASPQGCFVAEKAGRPVGTATTVSFGKEVAWIGMVLVAPEARGGGIGKALLNHCLTHLRKRGVRCIKLDATPAGQPLYEKLGFQAEWSLARWEGTVDPERLPAAPAGCVQRLSLKALPTIEPLDLQAFGATRGFLLRDLLRQSEHAVWQPSPAAGGAPAEGFGFLRPGSRALYLGPAACATPEAGLAIASALLKAAADRTVYWDIPDIQEEAVSLARQLGFRRQRPFMRMFLGENANPGNPLLQLALLDPAMG